MVYLILVDECLVGEAIMIIYCWALLLYNIYTN